MNSLNPFWVPGWDSVGWVDALYSKYGLPTDDEVPLFLEGGLTGKPSYSKGLADTDLSTGVYNFAGFPSSLRARY